MKKWIRLQITSKDFRNLNKKMEKISNLAHLTKDMASKHSSAYLRLHNNTS